VETSFDDTVMGADANATLLATGISQDTDMLGARIADIDGMIWNNGFDNEGDGAADLGPVQVLASASDAPRPGGNDADEFCFYVITAADAGGTPPNIQPVDILAGDLDADNDTIDEAPRPIATGDMLAVAWSAMVDVTSLEDCPPNTMYEVLDMSAGSVIASGSWTLTGRPDIETSNVPPNGGISNPDAIMDGRAYNFGGGGSAPYLDILLCSFDAIPDIPEPEINSKWWVDNLKLMVVDGELPPPPCPWDLNGDGSVGSSDLSFLLGAWGVMGGNGPADFDMSGSVGSGDLSALLGAWGPCPTN
jgi:hypothetical protein